MAFVFTVTNQAILFAGMISEAEEEAALTESDQLLFNPCEDELNQQWVFDILLHP